jgi:hypothetical protein
MHPDKIRAVPPSYFAAQSKYVAESSLSERELAEGLEDGTLKAWRVCNGQQWYQRIESSDVIHGVPRTDD